MCPNYFKCTTSFRALILLHRSGTTGIEGIDNLVGNANIPGRWVYRLEDSNGEEDGDLKCERWFNNEPNPSSFSDEPDPCPCTGVQAYFDERYQWVEPDYPFTYCFYTRFASSDGRGRKCCYYTSQEKFAALVIGFPGGGTIDRYHKLTPSLQENHTLSDVRPFRYCCQEAQSSSACDSYFKKRPSEGCEGYEPPEWSKLCLLWCPKCSGSGQRGPARLPIFFFLIWTKPGYEAFLRGGGKGKIKEQEKEEVKEKGNYLLFSLPCTLLCPPPRIKD